MAIKTKKQEPVSGLGELRVLRQDSDLNYDVQIAIMRSGLNENGWDYRNVGVYAKTFRGTPILCAYLPTGKIGDGHNMETVVGPDGKKRYRFTGPTAERIVGMIYDADDAVWTEEQNGETWAFARGKLWRFYNPELVDKIAKQGRMEVSAETNVEKAQKASDREIYTKWHGLGVTILGDDVAPAIPGANIKALESMQEAFKQMQLRAAAYHPKPQVEKQKGVKSLNAMSNAPLLEKMQEKFKGYTILNMTEKGERLLMLDDKGRVCTYQFQETDHGVIIPDRMSYATLTCQHSFEDGVSLDVDVMSMLADATKEANEGRAALESEVATLKAQNAEQKSQIEAMEKAELARRVQAAKDAVECAAKEAAECMADMPTDMTKGIMEKIEAGEYTSKMSADGKWIGAEEAVKDLKAMLGDFALQKSKEAMNAATKKFIWEGGTIKNNSADDSFEATVARLTR